MQNTCLAYMYSCGSFLFECVQECKHEWLILILELLLFISVLFTDSSIVKFPESSCLLSCKSEKSNKCVLRSWKHIPGNNFYMSMQNGQKLEI